MFSHYGGDLVKGNARFRGRALVERQPGVSEDTAVAAFTRQDSGLANG